jgi:hypothetical protein
MFVDTLIRGGQLYYNFTNVCIMVGVGAILGAVRGYTWKLEQTKYIRPRMAVERVCYGIIIGVVSVQIFYIILPPTTCWFIGRKIYKTFK